MNIKDPVNCYLGSIIPSEDCFEVTDGKNRKWVCSRECKQSPLPEFARRVKHVSDTLGEKEWIIENHQVPQTRHVIVDGSDLVSNLTELD